MNEGHAGMKTETAMNRGRLVTRAIPLMIGIGLFLGGCAGYAYDGYVGDPPYGSAGFDYGGWGGWHHGWGWHRWHNW